MHLKTYEELLEERVYTKEEVMDAALVVPKYLEKINLTRDEIALIFSEGSNFYQLEHPIVDVFGNEFRDSEGYYMAARTDDLLVKKTIALHSKQFGFSRKARVLYKLEQDKTKRIDYMREAITLKFDNNPQLSDKLLFTDPLQLIEYTYRKDDFFGIDQYTMKGQNVLGKLLMEYRENMAIDRS